MQAAVASTLVALATLALMPSIASAQTSPDYWGSPNTTVLRSGTGLCWHTTTWTPASASADCDGSMVKAAAPAPEPVAAAPLPILAAAAPSSRIETRKITLNAEELFDFDKSVLRPAGKDALDKVSAELKGVDYSNIAVVGHTDRMGSTKYNQKLSERRANTVAQYMVAHGVPAAKLSASGLGESQPVSKDCKGDAMSTKLVACLQPDRRVEVTVNGSRDVSVQN